MKNVHIALCAAVPVVAFAVVVVARPAGAQNASLLPGGSYVPVGPSRIYDTRLYGRFDPNKDVGIKVAGVGSGGVPATGVSAVAIDLTVINPATAGWIAAFDPATGWKGTSNINFAAHQTVAQMAIVPVDSQGYIGVRTTSAIDVGVDIEGYFTAADNASTTSGLFDPLTPARLMDTRSTIGGTAPGAGRTTTLQVTGRGGVPSAGVAAVVINMTAVGPTSAGYVTAFPAGSARAGWSVYFARGAVVAKRAIVPVGTDGKISFYNSAGTTHLVVDVAGYFTGANSSRGGSYFVPSPATRLVDSRQASNPKWSTPGKTNAIPLTVDGSASNAAPSVRSVTPTTAVVLTLTSVSPPAAGFVSAYPAGTSRPPTSDLNTKVGAVINNAAITTVGANGAANLYSAAAGNILVDASGYFVRPPATPSAAGMWNTWDQPTYPATQPVMPAVRTNGVHGVSSIIEFRSGDSFALRPDGTVTGWRAPAPPYRHDPTYPLDSSASVHTVAGLTGVTALAASGILSGTGFALRGDGTVLSWGDNLSGELGRTGGNASPAPVAISDVIRIGAANQIGYAVKADGTVWAWGRNNRAQLGDGTTANRTQPVQVVGLSDIVSIAGAGDLSYAVDSAGRLWQWGMQYGSNTPTAPQQLTGACLVGSSVLGAGDVNFELCLDGTVWQLDAHGDTSKMHQLPDLNAITAIAPGPGFFVPGVLALKNDGTVWRYNDDTSHYEQVYGLSGITTVGGGVSVYYAGTA